ncbi:MAG: hypothetical protein ACREJG_02845 [Candidatus Rokuibacteriota bacterium]
MLEQIVSRVPERWRELVELLVAPIVWIPRMQQALIDFFVESPSGWIAVGKFAFLLLPLLLAVCAIWCTQLSLYTLPFRSGRVRFIATLLLTWWDAARAVWLFWVGVVRLAGVLCGWAITIITMALKLAFDGLRQAVLVPFTVTGRMTENYFRPGVPWIAFLMLLFWCALEAAIFTYTLFPTVTEVLLDITGAEETARFAGPFLYLFLLVLIMGSFACVQAFVEAVKKRELKFIVQIVLIELFVMFFEVMFLYRELIDAITPWIYQQTGGRVEMGIVFTLSLATFGWVGIRGMTWFLFGQFGTPPLLAFISRQPMAEAEDHHVATTVATSPGAWWRAPLEDFKREIGWLHERSDELVEYLALPVLHLLAAGLNFGMVLFTGRPVFSLPFKGVKEVMDTRDLLASMQLQARKGASA